MRLAQAMLADALRWRAQGGAPRALWRGDELARALDIPLGPRVGELLEELARAQYAGDDPFLWGAFQLVGRGTESFQSRRKHAAQSL